VRMSIRLCALVSATSLLVLAGCAPSTRFEWGNYEGSLYSYYKAPSERAQYKAELVKAINAGVKSNRVAPGLYAELGYLQMEDGDIPAAQVSFSKEMALFPESKPFLTSISAKLFNTNGKPAS
jgi:hypothetical protein